MDSKCVFAKWIDKILLNNNWIKASLEVQSTRFKNEVLHLSRKVPQYFYLPIYISASIRREIFLSIHCFNKYKHITQEKNSLRPFHKFRGGICWQTNPLADCALLLVACITLTRKNTFKQKTKQKTKRIIIPFYVSYLL